MNLFGNDYSNFFPINANQTLTSNQPLTLKKVITLYPSWDVLNTNLVIKIKIKKLQTTNLKLKFTNPTYYQQKHAQYQSPTTAHQSITKKKSTPDKGTITEKSTFFNEKS